MPPVNTIVVQTVLLPPDRQDETALAQAKRLLSKALEPVNDALEGRGWLGVECAGWVVRLVQVWVMRSRRGCVGDEMPHVKAYGERIGDRPAFKAAIELQ